MSSRVLLEFCRTAYVYLRGVERRAWLRFIPPGAATISAAHLVLIQWTNSLLLILIIHPVGSLTFTFSQHILWCNMYLSWHLSLNNNHRFHARVIFLKQIFWIFGKSEVNVRLEMRGRETRVSTRFSHHHNTGEGVTEIREPSYQCRECFYARREWNLFPVQEARVKCS